MNLSYKLVKNKQSGELVVASELAKGHKKNTRKTIAASLVLLASINAGYGQQTIDLKDIEYKSGTFNKENSKFTDINNNSQERFDKIGKEHFLINDGSTKNVKFSNVKIGEKSEFEEGSFETVTVDQLISADAVKLYKKDGTELSLDQMPSWISLNFAEKETITHTGENNSSITFDIHKLPDELSFVTANPVTNSQILVKQPPVTFYNFNIATTTDGTINLNDTTDKLELDFGQAKKTSLFTADSSKSNKNTNITVGDTSTTNNVNVDIKFDKGYVAGGEDSLVKDKVSFGQPKAFRGLITANQFAGEQQNLANSLAEIARRAGKEGHIYNVSDLDSLKTYQADLINAVTLNVISPESYNTLFEMAFKQLSADDYYVEIDYDPTKKEDSNLYLEGRFSDEVGILSILKAVGEKANIVINQNAVMNVTNGDVAYLDNKSEIDIKNGAKLTATNGNIAHGTNNSVINIEQGADLQAYNGRIVKGDNDTVASNKADTTIGHNMGNVSLSNQSKYTNEAGTTLTYQDNFITDNIHNSTFDNKGAINVGTSNRDTGKARSATTIAGGSTYTNHAGATLNVGINDAVAGTEVEKGGNLAGGVTIDGNGTFINDGTANLGKKIDGSNANITYKLPTQPTENDFLIKDTNTIISAIANSSKDAITIQNNGVMTIGDQLSKTSDNHIQHAAGINVEYNGNTENNNIEISNAGTINVGGYHSVGIRAKGNIGDLQANNGKKITNAGTINVIGANSIGIVATNGATIYNNGTINIGGDSKGIVTNNSQLDKNMNRRNYGLKSEDGATIYTAADSLNLLSNDSVGAYARQGGTIHITGNADKTITGSTKENLVYYWIAGKRLDAGNYVSSKINFDSSVVKLASDDKNSTFFRVDQGAEFNGTSGTEYNFSVNGQGSSGLHVASAGTVVNADNGMTFNINGENTTGIYVTSGAGSKDADTKTQGSVTLGDGATVNVKGTNASAAVVDGSEYNVNNVATGKYNGAILNSSASFNAKEIDVDSGAVAYRLINSGTLNHSGNIDFIGDISKAGTATGIYIKGGTLNNEGNITVNGTGIDIYHDTKNANRIDNKGTITAVNGIAAVRINKGASFTAKGSDKSLISGNRSADAIRVHDGATLTTEKAQIAVNGSGAGIHFMNTDTLDAQGKLPTFTLKGTGNITVQGNEATGILVQGENGKEATANFDSSGSDLHITVKEPFGGNGITTHTSGYVYSGSDVTIESSQGGSALIVKGKTNDIRQSGNLTSNSATAVVDLTGLDTLAGTTSFLNTGKIESKHTGGTAVLANSGENINFVNQGTIIGKLDLWAQKQKTISLTNNTNARISGDLIIGEKSDSHNDVRTNIVKLFGGSQAENIIAESGDTTVTLQNVTETTQLTEDAKNNPKKDQYVFKTLSANGGNKDTIELINSKYTLNHDVAINWTENTGFEALKIDKDSVFELYKTDIQLHESGTNDESGIFLTDESSVLKVTNDQDFNLNHKLVGVGRVEADLSGKTLTMDQYFIDNNKAEFQGTLALKNTLYSLATANTTNLTKATLEANTDSLTTVNEGVGVQKIGGLKFAGGRVEFKDTLSNLQLTTDNGDHADGMIKVDDLYLKDADGVISVEVQDMYHTAKTGDTVFKSILEHDQDDSLIHIVEATNIHGDTVPDDLKLEVNRGTEKFAANNKVRVVQGLMDQSTEVAKGHYDYSLAKRDDGLHVAYQLEAIELLSDKNLVLNAAEGKSGKSSDLNTQIIGTGNLIIDTASKHISLTNDRAAKNTYSGTTTVRNGDLYLESTDVLGRTSNLIVENGTIANVFGLAQNISGTAQSVGNLDLQLGGTVDLGTNGHLTITDKLSFDDELTSIVNGQLKGGSTSELTFIDSSATVKSANTDLKGSVALKGKSIVNAQNANALGNEGVINIEQNAQLRLTDTNQTIQNFAKQLANNGEIVVTSGSKVNVTADNTEFTGQFTIGEKDDTNNTLVNITDEKALGKDNIVHISKKGTLNLTTGFDTQFNHKLSGTGVFETNLENANGEAARLTMGETANPSENQDFIGTLELTNTLYTLDSGANTKALTKATLDVKEGSTVTVADGKGVQNIGTLVINDNGTVDFENKLSNKTGANADGSIKVNLLDTDHTGRLVVNLDDMHNTIDANTVSILAQDDAVTSIQLIDASEYNADSKLNFNINYQDETTQASSKDVTSITQSIVQGADGEVAKGTYDYKFNLVEKIGIALQYRLKAIELLAKGTNAFVLQAAEGKNSDLSAQLSGEGDLIVNTVGNISLSNSKNNYTGSTTVKNGVLHLNADNVFGQTSNLVVNDGTVKAYGTSDEATGTSNTVGALNIADKGIVDLGTNGQLTVTGQSDSLINGSLLGDTGSKLVFDGAKATVNSVNNDLKGNVDLTGTSVVAINNAHALGTVGTVNIADESQLRVTNTDTATEDLSKQLAGKGEVVITNGSTISIDKDTDNSKFLGQFTIGENVEGNTSSSLVKITDEKVLGADNVVQINEKGTLSLATDKATEFGHLLSGDGTFSVDLGKNDLSIMNTKKGEQSTGQNFTGTLALTNTNYALDGGDNTKAMESATIQSGEGSVVTVAADKGIQKVGGLDLAGGKVVFEDVLSNLVLTDEENKEHHADGLIKVDHLDLSDDKGTIAINVKDMHNTPNDDIPVHKSILEHDEGVSLIKIIDSTKQITDKTISGDVQLSINRDGKKLDLIDYNVTHDIVENGNKVAKGTYGYGLQLEEDGLHVAYKLTQVELTDSEKGLTLTAVKDKNSDLSAKVIGAGNLIIDTAGNVSLSNNTNNYTGSTTVTSGTLSLNNEKVLGQVDKHTSVLNIKENGIVKTNSNSQYVGALNIDQGGSIDIGSKGQLTVTGQSESIINGSLQGDTDSKLVFNNAKATVSLANENLKSDVDLTGSSVVQINNAEALGIAGEDHGVISIATGSELRVANVDAELDFSKGLSGNGKFTVTTGSDTDDKATDSIVNLVGDNASFEGLVTIGQNEDAALTTLAITEESALGSNNTVQINEKGTLSLTTNEAIEFGHLLSGTGTFATDLGGKALTMGNAKNGENFEGTLALTNTLYDLKGNDDANTQAISNATLEVKGGSTVTVADVAGSTNTIRGLDINGGTVNFADTLSNQSGATADGLISTNKLETNAGTLVVNLGDMHNTLDAKTVSILAQDDEATLIQLIEAANYDAVADQLDLAINYEGINDALNTTVKGQITEITQSIIQGNDGEVAQGKYTYNFEIIKDKGIALAYQLNELKLTATEKGLGFILQANKNVAGDLVDLSAKVTGVGNLIVNTESEYVSLSNADNDYTGSTTVSKGDLYLENSGVLGQTSELNVGADTTVNVFGKTSNKNGVTQSIGALNVAENGTVDLGNQGELTVTGKLDSIIDGALKGDTDSKLVFDDANATINSINTELKGAVNLVDDSNVQLNSSQALGNSGTVSISQDSELKVANTDVGLDFTKALSGNGKFTVTTGVNGVDSIVNLVGNNADNFNGLVTIGNIGDKGTTTLAITNKNALGKGNTVQINEKGTLSLAIDKATEFGHLLLGDGTFSVDLGKNDLSIINTKKGEQSTGQNFTGTLALTNTNYALDGGDNTKAMESATIQSGEGSVVTVAADKGIQKVGGLDLAGGKVVFEDVLSNLVLTDEKNKEHYADGLIKVDHLDLSDDKGTIAINVKDMHNTEHNEVPVHKSILEHDEGVSLIKIIDSDDVESTLSDNVKLSINHDGKQLDLKESQVTHDIVENGRDVAKGTYGYGLELKKDESDKGLHVTYGLIEVELTDSKQGLTLTAAPGKDSDLSAKVTGSGNLIIDTVGEVSLSNNGNEYIGSTTVNNGVLHLNANNVLGQTSSLNVNNGTVKAYDTSNEGKGTSNIVGALNIAENGTVDLGKQGELTVTGQSDSTINGSLQVDTDSKLVFDDANATINSINTELKGAVNLVDNSNVQLNNSQALGNSGTISISQNSELKVANTDADLELSKGLSGNGKFTVTTGLDADGNATDSIVNLVGNNSSFEGLITIGDKADQNNTVLIVNQDSIGKGSDILVNNKGTLRLDHAYIDNNWAIDKKINGTGGLDKVGQGVIELSQDSSNYTGKTTVYEGQLVTGKNGDESYTLNSQEVEIKAGGSLLASSGTIKGIVNNYGQFIGSNGLIDNSVNNYGEFIVGNLDKSVEDQATIYTVTGDFTNHKDGVIRLSNEYPLEDNTDKNNTTPVKHGNVGNQLHIQGNYIANGGSIILNTVLNEGLDKTITDSIHVAGNVIKQGDATKLYIQNYGGLGAFTQLDAIKVISVDGKSDNGAFALGRPATIGVYEYTLHKGQKDNNWYLYSNPDYPVYGQPHRRNINPLVGGYLANMSTSFEMFNMTLHDRLGNPSYGQSVLTGDDRGISAWGRIATVHRKYRAAQDGLSISGDFYLAQVGADLIKVAAENDGSRRFGVMASYGSSDFTSRSRSTGSEATGKIDQAMSVGIYGTWYQPESWFVDAWLQYSHFKNEVSMKQGSTNKYNSNLLSASIEVGYNHKTDEFDNGDYLIIQPNAQIIYGRLATKAFKDEASGLFANKNTKNNIQTRLGMKLFYVNANENNEGFKPYVEANWIHNSSSAKVTFNDRFKFSSNAPNDIFEVKVGAEGNLSEDWSVWGNVGYQFGKQKYKGYKATIGVKYTW